MGLVCRASGQACTFYLTSHSNTAALTSQSSYIRFQQGFIAKRTLTCQSSYIRFQQGFVAKRTSLNDRKRALHQSTPLSFFQHAPHSSKRSSHSRLRCSAAPAEKDVEGTPAASRGLGAGIARDVKGRLRHYVSDFSDGLHPKAAAATFFLAFACLAPCIAFGGLMAAVTEGAIGVVESILGTAACGVIYALLAGQPLTLLGPTGLVVVFVGLLHKATQQLGLPFLPVYAWAGLWSALFLFILAATEASDLIRHFTRFTDETFSLLISIGFINEACKHIAAMFNPAKSPVSTDGALLSFILALGTYNLARALTSLRKSRYFIRPVREILSDFGPPLAIFTMSYLPRLLLPSVSLPVLAVPAEISTTSGRPWLVPLGGLPPWVIAAAAVPAALFTLLVFLDQNITTRLVNSPEYPLKKGWGYHLDLAVLAALIAGCSLLGLPWLVASTVPSLSHVRSLAIFEKASPAASNGVEEVERPVQVQENRITGIAIHLCVGASLLLLPLLRLVPVPVTDGVFLYMGITSLAGNQFADRLHLWLCDPKLTPSASYTKGVPPATLHGYTALQLACLAALWTLKHTPYGILFPLLILALLPVRNLVAARLFAPEHLAVLDSH